MFFKKLNPGQKFQVTIIKLEEDNNVVHVAIGNAIENNKKRWCNLPQLMMLEAEREEMHTPIHNKQQQLSSLSSMDMVPSPPENDFFPEGVTLSNSASQIAEIRDTNELGSV